MLLELIRLWIQMSSVSEGKSRHKDRVGMELDDVNHEQPLAQMFWRVQKCLLSADY